jgi:hypothetical protein
MMNESTVDTKTIQVPTTPYKIASSQTTLLNHNPMSNQMRDVDKTKKEARPPPLKKHSSKARGADPYRTKFQILKH